MCSKRSDCVGRPCGPVGTPAVVAVRPSPAPSPGRLRKNGEHFPSSVCGLAARAGTKRRVTFCAYPVRSVGAAWRSRVRTPPCCRHGRRDPGLSGREPVRTCRRQHRHWIRSGRSPGLCLHFRGILRIGAVRAGHSAACQRPLARSVDRLGNGRRRRSDDGRAPRAGLERRAGAALCIGSRVRRVRRRRRHPAGAASIGRRAGAGAVAGLFDGLPGDRGGHGGHAASCGDLRPARGGRAARRALPDIGIHDRARSSPAGGVRGSRLRLQAVGRLAADLLVGQQDDGLRASRGQSVRRASASDGDAGGPFGEGRRPGRDRLDPGRAERRNRSGRR